MVSGLLSHLKGITMYQQMERSISMYELGMKSMGWECTEICSIVQNLLTMHLS